MTILQAVILAALQGVTEFLPVSSSGHLVVMRELMDLEGIPVLFDVLLHVSTLAVVIIIFRHRVWGILRSLGRYISRRNGESDRENGKLFLIIIVATVFTVLLGLGISYLGVLEGQEYPHCYKPIIERNTALPVTRTEPYYTVHPLQEAAQIERGAVAPIGRWRQSHRPATVGPSCPG